MLIGFFALILLQFSQNTLPTRNFLYTATSFLNRFQVFNFPASGFWSFTLFQQRRGGKSWVNNVEKYIQLSYLLFFCLFSMDCIFIDTKTGWITVCYPFCTRENKKRLPRKKFKLPFTFDPSAFKRFDENVLIQLYKRFHLAMEAFKHNRENVLIQPWNWFYPFDNRNSWNVSICSAWLFWKCV